MTIRNCAKLYPSPRTRVKTIAVSEQSAQIALGTQNLIRARSDRLGMKTGNHSELLFGLNNILMQHGEK